MANMENVVLKSAQYIAEHSEYVTVADDTTLEKVGEVLANEIKSKDYDQKAWKQHPLHPKSTENAASWIFVIDLLNFSFWSEYSDSERYAVQYRGQRWTGYWALCACVNRALEENILMTDASFMSSIDMKMAEHIFRADSTSIERIPLLEERVGILNQAGLVLMEHFGSSVENLILSANKSSRKCIELLLKFFPSFRDVHEYHGVQVQLHKRVQIFIADIWACYEGQNLGEFFDIDEITMFADYRVPQALVSLGVLEYKVDFLEYLKTCGYLTSGSVEEVEIRGCSIWSVQKLLIILRRSIATRKINAIILDFFLWDYAKSKDLSSIPIHKTRSVYY